MRLLRMTSEDSFATRSTSNSSRASDSFAVSLRTFLAFFCESPSFFSCVRFAEEVSCCFHTTEGASVKLVNVGQREQFLTDCGG